MSFTSVMLIPKDCYYNKDTGAPLFAAFFKHRAEMKRKYAKQFLRYLRKHEGKICLPVMKRPDLGHWGKGGQAQKSALGLESKLTKACKTRRPWLLRTVKMISHTSRACPWINRRGTPAVWNTSLHIIRNQKSRPRRKTHLKSLLTCPIKKLNIWRQHGKSSHRSRSQSQLKNLNLLHLTEDSSPYLVSYSSWLCIKINLFLHYIYV